MIAFLESGSLSHNQFKKMCHELVHEFDTIPITGERKPRVGIVGEILVNSLLLLPIIILRTFWKLKGLRPYARISLILLITASLIRILSQNILASKNQRLLLPTGESRESTGFENLLTKPFARAATSLPLPISTTLQKWQSLLYLRETRLERDGSLLEKCWN